VLSPCQYGRHAGTQARRLSVLTQRAQIAAAALLCLCTMRPCSLANYAVYVYYDYLARQTAREAKEREEKGRDKMGRTGVFSRECKACIIGAIPTPTASMVTVLIPCVQNISCH
jgi:hypothetical protein